MKASLLETDNHTYGLVSVVHHAVTALCHECTRRTRGANYCLEPALQMIVSLINF